MPDLPAPRGPTEDARRRLPLRLTRRQLFSALATEIAVARGRARGGSAFKLIDLGALTDLELAVLVPVIAPGCVIEVRDGAVWGQPPSLGRPLRLFRAAVPQTTAFNRFNGLTPLGAAGRHVADEMGWEEAEGFAFVRGMFLALVEVGLCLPG